MANKEKKYLLAMRIFLDFLEFRLINRQCVCYFFVELVGIEQTYIFETNTQSI